MEEEMEAEQANHTSATHCMQQQALATPSQHLTPRLGDGAVDSLTTPSPKPHLHLSHTLT